MAKLPNYQYVKNLVEKLMLEDLRNKVILQILETLNGDISTISFKLQKIDSPAPGKVAQYQLVYEDGTPITGSVLVDIPDVKQGNNIQVTKGSDGSFTIALSSSALSGYLTKAVADTTYATKTSLSSHTSNSSNPHNVTKSQIGLGNVDNTSDLDKPISTAVQSKLAVYTTVPELTAAYTIPANATTQEKIYQISIGATVYSVTGAEGIIWQNGVAPVVEANSTLVVSVINNLAVWGTFKA